MLAFHSCRSNPADTRLDQMDIVISKWEKQLQSGPANFEELVYIQTNITVYDLDERTFEFEYGSLNEKQQTRLMNIRVRFKKLIRNNK